MRYTAARKLHSGDQVMIKSSNKVATVIQTIATREFVELFVIQHAEAGAVFGGSITRVYHDEVK